MGAITPTLPNHLPIDALRCATERSQADSGCWPAQIVTAVAIYQVDNGHPPAQLAELVPAYLAVVPSDLGVAFSYRILRKGSKISIQSGIPQLVLAHSQALLEGNGFEFPAPVPGKSLK